MYDLNRFFPEDNEMLTNFVEALCSANLQYSAMDLFRAGAESWKEIDGAVKLSIQTLIKANLNPQMHFKFRFLTDIASGNIVQDWKMSKTGFVLTLLNIQGKNPLLNKLKVEIIERYIN
jgi:hypothetical protein